MAEEQFRHAGTEELRRQALRFPGVNEGDSCVKRAFRARSKGFLYLGETDDSFNVMLKVGASLDAAKAFTSEVPERRSVGKTNWVTLHFGADESPPPMLNDWIEESFRLLAPKKLISEFDADADSCS